jgi:hypothetical protein
MIALIDVFPLPDLPIRRSCVEVELAQSGEDKWESDERARGKRTFLRDLDDILFG